MKIEIGSEFMKICIIGPVYNHIIYVFWCAEIEFEMGTFGFLLFKDEKLFDLYRFWKKKERKA